MIHHVFTRQALYDQVSAEPMAPANRLRDWSRTRLSPLEERDRQPSGGAVVHPKGAIGSCSLPPRDRGPARRQVLPLGTGPAGGARALAFAGAWSERVRGFPYGLVGKSERQSTTGTRRQPPGYHERGKGAGPSRNRRGCRLHRQHQPQLSRLRCVRRRPLRMAHLAPPGEGHPVCPCHQGPARRGSIRAERMEARHKGQLPRVRKADAWAHRLRGTTGRAGGHVAILGPGAATRIPVLGQRLSLRRQAVDPPSAGC